MQRKITILRIIAIVLLVLQAISYLSSLSRPAEKPTDIAELTGYYFGYNLFLIIAIILLINVYSLKKRLKKQQQLELVDSIGKAE